MAAITALIGQRATAAVNANVRYGPNTTIAAIVTTVPKGQDIGYIDNVSLQVDGPWLHITKTKPAGSGIFQYSAETLYTGWVRWDVTTYSGQYDKAGNSTAKPAPVSDTFTPAPPKKDGKGSNTPWIIGGIAIGTLGIVAALTRNSRKAK